MKPWTNTWVQGSPILVFDKITNLWAYIRREGNGVIVSNDNGRPYSSTPELKRATSELMKGLVNIHASKLMIENIGHFVVTTNSLEVRFIRLIIENTIEETGDIARLIQFIAQKKVCQMEIICQSEEELVSPWISYSFYHSLRSWGRENYLEVILVEDMASNATVCQAPMAVYF
ncbi:uncharacterized protein LOC122081723 [Macadamia integrifolia]|uniref:uncharacterized protein LOC122081723 n=1 Tax=Macadamia integrifolia TaxID=60698 RepID=UPI001C4F7C2B|nr:uncharacterized protein LOC122081723 [Macadamia integrifolia]XP_042504876.1 uncharacterized protein LOC122081723 [Macadamia integrifolia]XP_042504877.1 uncharacterized protein LOC122081723 [Macadamia integrifolia]